VLGVIIPMNNRQKTTLNLISSLLLIAFLIGCDQPQRSDTELVPEIELGTTIGQLAEVFAFDAVRVEGFAIVGGLAGTGSQQCPISVRTYLKKYILKQLPQYQQVDELINSPDTAVVIVQAVIPPAASKGQRFDVKVTALPGTQTTSLENGFLYGADLRAAGTFGISTKVLATAEGPIFINKISDSPLDNKTGFVLGGAEVLDEYKLNLALFKPNYKTAALIRDRLNERFGSNTASAISPGQIELKVPVEYKNRKVRFVEIVRAMYLTENRQINADRIATFIRKLATEPDKYKSEIALEMLGTGSLDKLAALLNHSDEEVRLRAGRCMLFLGSNRSLAAVRRIATDQNSSYRIAALEAIADAANRNDAAALARTLLRDDDFDIRLAAYEQLRKLNDVTIMQKTIADNFLLETIAQTRHRMVFVSRSGQPRVAMFGSPIYLAENAFVESTDGNITINAPAGQEFVLLIRKHPKRPNVLLQRKSSYELSDIIQTLCNPSVTGEDSKIRPGLGVSYDEMAGLLELMAAKNAIDAQFRAGPVPKIP